MAKAIMAAIARDVWTGTILAGTVGSTVHGTNISDGIEDHDVMGVCIEPIGMVVGLTPFEQFIYRTAVQREGEHNARSKAGDVDLVIYSLRKYVRLALRGNPTILTLLFTPNQQCVRLEDEGVMLRGLAPAIVSKKAGGAYLGYMSAQAGRLLGTRGGQHGAGRPELINKFGYDSKYAAHIIRLGLQGQELMNTGQLTLPMTGVNRDFVLDVRNGKVPFGALARVMADVEDDLKAAVKRSPLPEIPDTEAVERWLVEAYRNFWSLINKQ